MRDVRGEAIEEPGSGHGETVILHRASQTFLDALAACRFRKAVDEAGRDPGTDVTPSHARSHRCGDRTDRAPPGQPGDARAVRDGDIPGADDRPTMAHSLK